ncbi:MAG: IS630 family transposase [Gemmatimonadaceae bacterium]
MRYVAAILTLSPEETETLERWTRAGRSEHRQAFRARIILRAAAGAGTNAIAQALGTRPATVSKWRTRFATRRLAGLRDAPRPGKPRVYTAATERRILAQLDERPPAGYTHWNGRLVARALGDVSADQVWATLRKYRIALARRRSWCVSTDPEFARKAADLVALYLHPPENALVIAVDEKPHIQALERAQGYLKFPNGRALTGFAHEYTRHGTSTLFAALVVATGQVVAAHYHRRRRVEFLAFMNRVVAAYPEQDLHVVLDNLSTHKPKHDQWLARHPRVHFHYTPTHASWLNLIEVWFSILSRAALRGASFPSVRALRDAIDAFVTAWQAEAHPFEWTKEVVHQVPLKKHYADLFK